MCSWPIIERPMRVRSSAICSLGVTDPPPTKADVTTASGLEDPARGGCTVTRAAPPLRPPRTDSPPPTSSSVTAGLVERLQHTVDCEGAGLLPGRVLPECCQKLTYVCGPRG